MGEVPTAVSEKSIPAAGLDASLVSVLGQKGVTPEVGLEGVFVHVEIPVAVDAWVSDEELDRVRCRLSNIPSTGWKHAPTPFKFKSLLLSRTRSTRVGT